MTKCILHGGSLGRESQKNQNFYDEVGKNLSQDAKILGIYFSREEDEITDLVIQDSARFIKNFPEQNFHYIVASKNPEVLSTQIQESDALFMSGGDEKALRKYLEKIDFKNAIRGKVISGSSAGANICSQYYFTNDRDTIEEGFGILPIKTICHYSEKNQDKYDLLHKSNKKLKTYGIKEEKFLVFDI